MHVYRMAGLNATLLYAAASSQGAQRSGANSIGEAPAEAGT